MYVIKNDAQMRSFGEAIGSKLRGGEVIELIGDVGSGKTTLTKGIGAGLLIDEDVQSPSFTINRVYEARDGLRLCHYDFYRLDDAGIMSHELIETMADQASVTVIEWAQTVENVLPKKTCVIKLSYLPDNEYRELDVVSVGSSEYLFEGIED